MKKFRKTRLAPPYTNDKPTFKRLYFPGTYIIYKVTAKEKTPLYVGYSATNVYKTMYRHFQSWEDERQIRVSYDKKGPYKVRIILCSSTTAEKLERALLKKLNPKDNPKKLATLFTNKDKKIIDDLNKTNVDFKLTNETEAPF